MTSASVERWRSLVRQELDRAKIPLPDDLILGVIWTESRGHPGTTNDKSGASGLMQVMPNTLKWYNRQTGDNIPLSALRSPSAATEQIRVGTWVLGQFWRSAYRYLRSRLTEIPTDELAKIADLFYVAGPGATKRRLDRVTIPFYSNVAARFPGWNALPHVANVWSQLPSVEWNLPSISMWLESHDIVVRRSKQSAILAIAAVIAGYWWFFRRQHGKGKGKDEKA